MSANIHELTLTAQQDLRDIKKEIRLLKTKIDKLENIVEKRLVGESKPDRYERKAVADFERRKKAGDLEFMPLSKFEARRS
jgi:hypothetical protein